MRDVDWKPIETAPRDGSLVRLCGEDFDGFEWRWSAMRGCWKAEGRLVGWNDGELGPTHWARVE